VLHVPVTLALVVIDHYLGGDGMHQPSRAQLTEVERNLAGGIVEDLWNEVPHPFASFATLNPAMVSTAASALLVQVGRPGTLCVVARLRASIGDAGPLPLELCLPGNIVRSLVDQLERHQSHGALGTGVGRHDSRRRLLSVPVELKLGYPPIGLTPSELLGLRVGDVIHLGSFEPGTPQALPLTLGDVAYGTGVLVEKGNRLACTVLTKKEPNDEQ
jgi:flagellar motor switch protein FliM